MADRGFARAMRRKTQWVGMGSESATAAIPQMVAIAVAGTAILSEGFVATGGPGFLLDEETTVTRTIGQVTAKIGAGTANLEGEFALGCVVARAEAITAGTGSLPSPISDPDAEWLYYFSGQLSRGGTLDIDNGVASLRQAFDVRGQRIVRAGSQVVWVGEAAGTTVDVGVTGRYLVKLT